jgi:hypothetical protein
MVTSVTIAATETQVTLVNKTTMVKLVTKMAHTCLLLLLLSLSFTAIGFSPGGCSLYTSTHTLH